MVQESKPKQSQKIEVLASAKPRSSVVSTHECQTSALDSTPKKQQLFDSLSFHDSLTPALSLSPNPNQTMCFRRTQMSFCGGSFQENAETVKNKKERQRVLRSGICFLCVVCGYIQN